MSTDEPSEQTIDGVMVTLSNMTDDELAEFARTFTADDGSQPSVTEWRRVIAAWKADRLN